MKLDRLDALMLVFYWVSSVVIGLAWWTEAISTVELGATFCLYVVISVAWMCEVHMRGEK